MAFTGKHRVEDDSDQKKDERNSIMCLQFLLSVLWAFSAWGSFSYNRLLAFNLIGYFVLVQGCLKFDPCKPLKPPWVSFSENLSLTTLSYLQFAWFCFFFFFPWPVNSLKWLIFLESSRHLAFWARINIIDIFLINLTFSVFLWVHLLAEPPLSLSGRLYRADTLWMAGQTFPGSLPCFGRSSLMRSFLCEVRTAKCIEHICLMGNRRKDVGRLWRREEKQG